MYTTVVMILRTWRPLGMLCPADQIELSEVVTKPDPLDTETGTLCTERHTNLEGMNGRVDDIDSSTHFPVSFVRAR